MRSKILVGALLVMALGVIYALAPAQTQPVFPVPAKNNEQAILKATDAYVNAFNKGDLDGVLAGWDMSPEYVDEVGKSYKGREALAEMFKAELKEFKGSQMQVKSSAIRFLTDDVAMQDGNVITTSASGEETSPFNAIWLKKDEKWLLHLVRNLSSQTVAGEEKPEPPHNAVKDMAWLIGAWTHEDKDLRTNLNAHWMPGEMFLVLDYSISRKDKSVMTVTQIIGWDPTVQRLHSWVFDSLGGLGEGNWSKVGNTWTVEVSGVTLDGRHGSGTHMFTRGEGDSFTFKAVDRNLDGQPVPDVTVTYQRNKASK